MTDGQARAPDAGHFELRPFKPADAAAVRSLIHRTIDASYASFYSPPRCSLVQGLSLGGRDIRARRRRVGAGGGGRRRDRGDRFPNRRGDLRSVRLS